MNGHDAGHTNKANYKGLTGFNNIIFNNTQLNTTSHPLSGPNGDFILLWAIGKNLDLVKQQEVTIMDSNFNFVKKKKIIYKKKKKKLKFSEK